LPPLQFSRRPTTNDEVGGRVGGADWERVLEANPAPGEALGMRRTKAGLFLALLVPGVRVLALVLGRRVVVCGDGVRDAGCAVAGLPAGTAGGCSAAA
jgi:hypothetical protein